MRASETIPVARPMAGSGGDGDVSLWWDSARESAEQHGLILALVLLAHVAYNLLLGP